MNNNDFEFKHSDGSETFIISLSNEQAKLSYKALGKYLKKQPEALKEKAEIRLINAQAHELEIENNRLTQLL